MSWLVNPGCGIEKGFSAIHGIATRDVAACPGFSEVYRAHVAPVLAGKVIVSHGLFDSRAMVTALHDCGLDVPQWTWMDSTLMAGDLWPGLANVKLQTVAAHLGYPFRHHDAADDAVISAVIALRALKAAGCRLEALIERYGYVPSPEPLRVSSPVSRWSAGYAARVASDPTGAGCFNGEIVVMTGEFAEERETLAARIAQAGGAVRDSVTRKTTILFVAGDGPWGAASSKIRRAQELLAEGRPVRILREPDLMRLLGQ